jgi:beta-lactamase class A
MLGYREPRLDRREAALNEAKSGDPRDTTTPAAMLLDMRELLIGGPLTRAVDSMGDLQSNWRKAPEGCGAVGLARGDKMGISGNGAVNDIASF